MSQKIRATSVPFFPEPADVLVGVDVLPERAAEADQRKNGIVGFNIVAHETDEVSPVPIEQLAIFLREIFPFRKRLLAIAARVGRVAGAVKAAPIGGRGEQETVPAGIRWPVGDRMLKCVYVDPGSHRPGVTFCDGSVYYLGDGKI